MLVDGWELDNYTFDPVTNRIRSHYNGRILKPFKTAAGEHKVVLSLAGKPTTFKMSHVVYSEMLGKNVKHNVIRYRDQNLDNYSIENLYIAC